MYINPKADINPFCSRAFKRGLRLCYTPETEWSFIFHLAALERLSEFNMERESLEMDVVFVGAGPANLSGALHLARLVSDHNDGVANGEREVKPLGDLQVS